MITRRAEYEIKVLATQFRAVAVVGPRQSGKTTLVRYVFGHMPYVNLENPDIRRYALEDARGFLSNYPNGALLDEAQRAPELFSYLQEILDQTNTYGLFKGSYPALYNHETDPVKWYANYIRTYVERDVRLLKNINDLIAFERFLRLCAGRIGQLLNMSSLAVEVGVDTKTIGSWISVLESSFIIFRLQPYHENYNKRIVKMPKLYFYDTGLAVALLGIENSSQLALHPFRGNLFENMVVVDFLKRRYNAGKSNNLFFWRNNVGNEIDLLLTNGDIKMPIEIKSGQTVTGEYFRGIQYWNKMTKTEGGFVVYGGDMIQKRSNGITVVPYTEMNTIATN